MLWTIVRRECLDHLISLRFALLSILLLLLTANGLIFSGDQRSAAVSRYNADLRAADEELEQRCGVGLGHLAERGPGNLYRRPGRLFFCVAGRDQHIPSRIEGGTHRGHGWGRDEFSYSWHMPWNLIYHLDSPAQANPVLPSFAELDWAFIIGLVASLMALLLTYDAVSGERQRGTLRLLMANPIPRDVVLLGKFLAALLSVGIPLLCGLLISLLILHTGGRVNLDGADWGRLLLIADFSPVTEPILCPDVLRVLEHPGIFVRSTHSPSISHSTRDSTSSRSAPVGAVSTSPGDRPGIRPRAM